jgi:hypothetical protein
MRQLRGRFACPSLVHALADSNRRGAIEARRVFAMFVNDCSFMPQGLGRASVGSLRHAGDNLTRLSMSRLHNTLGSWRHASNELGQTLNFAASRQVHQTNDAKLGNGFCRYSITRWAAYRVLAELERFWLFEWAR